MSNLKSVGYREMNVSLVIEKCNDWLDRREKRIERKREELIEKELAKKDGLFYRAPKTREDAIKNLQSDHQFFSSWYRVESCGSVWVNRVEELKELCEAKEGSDVVLVSSDMSFLFK